MRVKKSQAGHLLPFSLCATLIGLKAALLRGQEDLLEAVWPSFLYCPQTVKKEILTISLFLWVEPLSIHP